MRNFIKCQKKLLITSKMDIPHSKFPNNSAENLYQKYSLKYVYWRIACPFVLYFVVIWRYRPLFFLTEPSRCMFHQQNGRMLVPGGHVQGTSAVSRHECELACVHHTDFTCRSFEFDPDSNRCLLSPDDSYSIPERLGPPSAQGRYFYERGSCIEGKIFHDTVNSRFKRWWV